MRIHDTQDIITILNDDCMLDYFKDEILRNYAKQKLKSLGKDDIDDDYADTYLEHENVNYEDIRSVDYLSVTSKDVYNNIIDEMTTFTMLHVENILTIIEKDQDVGMYYLDNVKVSESEYDYLSWVCERISDYQE